jgi:Domain of unknown function (DUF222)/HNH endonuclease
MCDGAGQPAGVGDALGMLDRALDYLTAADAGSLPAAVQAEALRALERAEARHTAVRARVLGAFAGQGGFEEDGHGSARTWLRWQTRVTTGAAGGVVAWARRLAAHPVIGQALAAGELSRSWAREICGWTDRLPEDRRGDADQILAGAARGGADLAGLAGLAREMYERCAPPDDREDGFGDRWLRLGINFRGAGRAEGDLTPGCAAALAAVLEALGKKAGPEDVRTGAQRRHDALEEACRRLIRAGMVPARAGQPTQVQVHLSLAQLRGLPGGSAAEDAWAAARASQPGWLTGPDAEAALCDATVIPVVTGHVDWAALDQLADAFQLCRGVGRHADPARPADVTDSGPGQPARVGQPAGPAATAGTGIPATTTPPASRTAHGPGTASAARSTGHGRTCGADTSPPTGPLSRATRDRLRRALLGLAADALSGPDGLAARLRAALDGRTLTSVSLPLDIGAATETIPAHLRRAATTRHPHCAFPGCDQPATVCDIHHLIPRARGGPTSLANLVPLCSFHHLTAIHRWGWTLTLHPDGTTTATSPDGQRILHSHSPPGQAA